MEIPVTCDREEPVAQGMVEETHKDIYYIDGCTQENQNHARQKRDVFRWKECVHAQDTKRSK